MNIKTALFALAGSVVVAASANAAETPLFAPGAATSILGHQEDWTPVSFSALSSIGQAVYNYTLLGEFTSGVATQTFSVNDHVVFAGSATGGAFTSSDSAITLTSFAFDSHVGGLHSVSTMTGNSWADKSGNFQIWQSTTQANSFALAYEDNYRIGQMPHGDYNDMTVAVRMNVVAVPEPETYALMGAGLGALALVSRRRRPA